MKPPILGILGKPLTLTYIDPEYRADLSVTVKLEDIVYDCSPHPTLVGIYQRTVIPETSGTFLLTWTIRQNEETITETQTLYIYPSEEYIHPVDIYVQDNQGLPVQDVMIEITKWTNGVRELVAYDYVNEDGKATFSLTNGKYLATLIKDRTVFTSNNFELNIVQEIDRYTHIFPGDGIEVPDVSYSPPVRLVTMSIALIDHKGDPVADRAILVTCLQPAKHEEKNTFIALEGRTVIKTSPTGECSLKLVPGILVEVAVENTSIIRRFIVPDADFSLADYLDNQDYFSTINVVYPSARRVT